MPNIHGDEWDAKYLLALGQIGERIYLDKPSYIYALWDPDTFQMHYIGRSANVKDRLQKHIDNARSDTYYRSSPSEWIRSLLAHDVRPEARILETIYPCWALHACDWTHWFLYSDDLYKQASFAYDIYVSAREIRHILHAAAQGQPLVNIVGTVTAQEALAGLDTTDINFLTVEREHAIWGMIHARNKETSPPSAGTMEKNIEDLMQNARNARTCRRAGAGAR
jgi:hypothetical protein